MIKIQKPAAPQVLVNNKATWTQNLLDAIATYGEYSKIPESEINRLLSHYRHKDIQDAFLEEAVILRLSILNPSHCIQI